MDGVSLLGKIVSINSVFPRERKLAEFLEKELANRGFATRRVHAAPGRFNVVGERGSRGKRVVLFGHMDTVPAYGKWKGSPWKMRASGDRLSGLGVFDMKAGCAAIICAVGEKTGRRLAVVFSIDEENVSQGSHALVKGGLLKNVEAVVSTEISTSQPCLGVNEITLGRRGRCVIEISVPGKSAHGAQAHLGVNAISEAGKLVLELERRCPRATHPLLPPPTQFVRKIYGESTSLSVPESAVVELDLHTVVPETPQSVLLGVNRLIRALYAKGKFRPIGGKRMVARLAARPNPYLKPYVTSQKNRHVRLLSGIVKRNAGKPPKFSYGMSVADDNRLAAEGVPVMSIGPMGGGEHTNLEWVSKKSYLLLVRILKDYVKSL